MQMAIRFWRRPWRGEVVGSPTKLLVILLICTMAGYLDSGCSSAGMVLVVCRGLEKDELEKFMQQLERSVRVDILCGFDLPWEGGLKR